MSVEAINECELRCHLNKWLPCHRRRFSSPLGRQRELGGVSSFLSLRGELRVLPGGSR